MVVPVVAAVAVVGLLLGCGPAADPSQDAGTGAEDPSSQAPSSAAPSGEPPSSATSAPRRADLEPSAPTGVAIEAIGLDEELIDLGLDEGGVLEVPDDPDRVGWYTEGGRPGSQGPPTVIVGHVDSTDGPAVFARLAELVPGDEIAVRAGESATTYVVTETDDVPQVPFPTEQVFGAASQEVLRLITCTGPYDSAAGRYTENRIVTAVPSA